MTDTQTQRRLRRRQEVELRRSQRVLRNGRLVSDIAPEHVHGRASGYNNWCCRCERCTEWSVERDRRHSENWTFNQQIIDRLASQRRSPSAPCVEAPAPARLEPTVEKVEKPVAPAPKVIQKQPPKPVEPLRQYVPIDEITVGSTDWKFEPSLVPSLIPAVRERVKTVEDIEKITRAYHLPDWSSPGGPEGRERRVYDTTQIIVATDGNVIWWGEREVATGNSELITATPKSLPKAKGGGIGTRTPTSTEDLMAVLKKAGCEVEHTGSGHIRVSRGGKSIIMPSTASDWRSLANTIGQARRAGLM